MPFTAASHCSQSFQPVTSALTPPTAPSLQISASVLHSTPMASGIFVPSVLQSWVSLAASKSYFAATETDCDLLTTEGGEIPGMSGNSLEEKTQDEELICIFPKAVMAFIRHHRLWLLRQPFNEPDQCCRSNTLVLNTSSVNCVFLCLLPHMRGSPRDPSAFPP